MDIRHHLKREHKFYVSVFAEGLVWELKEAGAKSFNFWLSDPLFLYAANGW